MQRWRKWNRWRKRRRWDHKREMKKKRNKKISLATWKKFHVQEKWCSSKREGGEGRERRGVAIEEEGKEVEGERELLSPCGRSSPSKRSFERERERVWKKEKKNVEERRTDQLFFLTSWLPTPTPSSMGSTQIHFFETLDGSSQNLQAACDDRLEKKRRPKSTLDAKTATSEILSSHLVQDQMREWTGLNRDRDRQRPILMDWQSRSSPVDRTTIGLCGTLYITMPIKLLNCEGFTLLFHLSIFESSLHGSLLGCNHSFWCIQNVFSIWSLTQLNTGIALFYL